MNCSDIQLELPRFIYAELDQQTRADVDAHLAACPTCAAELDALRRTTALLDDWEMPKIPSESPSAGQDFIAGSRSARRAFALRPILTGAIAALIAFGALVLLGANVSYNNSGFAIAFAGSQLPPQTTDDNMNEFLLVLHEDPREAADAPAEVIAQIVGEYKDWADQLAEEGRLAGGQKLTDEPGKILTAPGQQLAVADGSWTDADDIVTGFFQIRAASYDEAVEISRTCPHLKYGKHIELRRIENTQ